MTVIAVALAVRLPQLGLYGYEPDEIWTAEIAMGRGSAHLSFPKNVVIPSPVVFDLQAAAPWWHVWTNLQMTHPPLYWVTLRLWMNVFGTGDATERSLSVVTSVLAIAVLFDVVRLRNGPWPAVWASLLMALAEPQIAHGRLTRNYALLMLTALAAADAMVRIETIGMTRRRLVGLSLAVLATLLTHYFCVGTLAALLAYGLLRTRGRDRARILAAFAVAGLVYAVIWGPFLWRQRSLFSLDDEATLWLNERGPHHVAWTFKRFLLVPVEMLVGPVTTWWVPAVAIGSILYGVPVLLIRRRPELLLWSLWLIATPGFILGLDLARHSTHLYYVRYTLLSGPAVFALLASVATATGARRPRFRAAATAVPAIAAAACVAVVPRAFAEPDATVDPLAIQRQFQPLVNAKEAIAFVATGNLEWAAGENYLFVSRYFHPAPDRVVLLDRPASAEVLRELGRQSTLLVFTKTEDARVFIPGAAARDMVVCTGRGMAWTLTPPGSVRPTE